MICWCDANEVRFQIPPGPVSFAKKIVYTLSALVTSSANLRLQVTQGEQTLITSELGKVSWRSLEGRSLVRKYLKRAILYLLSLCPVAFGSVIELFRREKGIKKRLRLALEFINIVKLLAVVSSDIINLNSLWSSHAVLNFTLKKHVIMIKMLYMNSINQKMHLT